MTTADPVADAVGFPAPATSTPASPSGPPTTVGTTGQPTTTRTLSWIGLAVAAVGTALAALSVTVLSWASDTSFSDLRKVSDAFESSSYDDAVVAYHYGAWGWPLFLLLVVAGLVLVATVINRGDGTVLRLLVAAAAAAGAIVHAGYVAQMFGGPGPAPGFGAWAGSIGYLITIIGLAIATPRQRTRA